MAAPKKNTLTSKIDITFGKKKDGKRYLKEMDLIRKRA